MKKLRFGIIGPARIARKNWRASFYSGNCEITAVASRDLERSRKFIAECQAQIPFETDTDGVRQLRRIARVKKC